MSENTNQDYAKPAPDEPADLSGEMRRFASNMRRDDADARDCTRAPYADALDEFSDRVSKLEAAARLARTALDNLMGDTDLPDDDTDEMKAMQALNAVLAEPV